MQAFTRGQKSKLSDLGLSGRFAVAIELHSPNGTVDISCFGVDAGERLGDDRYMVFYNQPASPQREVVLDIKPGGAVFQVDLDALPASVAKLVFTAALDGGTMRGIDRAGIRLGDKAAFALTGADFASEKAVILGELYRKDGQWRFGAVGQGFDGGMSALLTHFGGVEAHAAPAPAPVVKAPEPAAAAAAGAASKVSLSKITLEKRGDKISLEKRQARGFGRVHVNLNWNRTPGAAPSRGFLGKLMGSAPRGVDLDLGCLYELADGGVGVVQALGDTWGKFDGRPYIFLEGDDRSGNDAGGENLFVNGDRFDQVRRIVVYAFIYQGVANWAQTDGVVTVHIPDHPTLEVRLDNGAAQGMCAIAMIENHGGQLQVTKLAEYFPSHRELDERFGFGLRWTVGSKD